MATVTAIVGGGMRYAEGSSEVAELVRVVFAEPRPGWAARLFAWRDGDSPRSGTGGQSTGQMRIVTDLALGWAALNYLLPEPHGTGWQGWDSYNPDCPFNAPELPFGRGSLLFPQSASLQLDAVIDAVREYCHGGVQPTCVKWQGARYF